MIGQRLLGKRTCRSPLEHPYRFPPPPTPARSRRTGRQSVSRGHRDDDEAVGARRALQCLRSRRLRNCAVTDATIRGGAPERRPPLPGMTFPRGPGTGPPLPHGRSANWRRRHVTPGYLGARADAAASTVKYFLPSISVWSARRRVRFRGREEMIRPAAHRRAARVEGVLLQHPTQPAYVIGPRPRQGRGPWRGAGLHDAATADGWIVASAVSSPATRFRHARLRNDEPPRPDGKITTRTPGISRTDALS